MKQWVEHFIILPYRWFKTNHMARKQQRQRCKACGCRDKFDFNVPDELWRKVVPMKFQNRVVCLPCFDDFAQKNEVDYSTSINTLYFAGNKASLQFSMSDNRDS